MRHQTLAPRVEARGLTPASPLAALRAHGAEFVAEIRTGIDRMARSCPSVPAPRQMFYDFFRARTITLETVGALIAACAQDPALSDAEYDRFAMRCYAWLLSLRPRRTVTIRAAWMHETETQAPADIAQAHALLALESRDRVALDRAIDETSAHFGATKELLARLMTARRELAMAPRFVHFAGVPV